MTFKKIIIIILAMMALADSVVSATKLTILVAYDNEAIAEKNELSFIKKIQDAIDYTNTVESHDIFTN